MPFRNVAVGVWSYNTHVHTNVPWGQRMPRLEQAVAALAQYRDQQFQAASVGADVKTRQLWADARSRFSMIFVAPEYMFAAPCASGLANPTQDRFLDQQSQEQILERLAQISERYGAELVFIPGSIAFKKPFLKQDDCLEDIANRYSRIVRRIEWGAEDIEKSYAAAGMPVSLAQAHNLPLSSPMSGLQARTTNDKLNLLKKGANNRFADTFIGQNKMYMMHRGKVIATYRKKCDFHEVLPGYAQRTVFVPGNKPGRATVAGIPLGLEICLDHGSGVLTNTASVTGSPPSIHVLASACVDIDPNNIVVRPGGYVLHASSEQTLTGAWRISHAGVTDVVNGNWQVVGGGALGLGVLELDFP